MIGVVCLVRVLGLSPSGWSTLGLTQRRLVQYGARLPTPTPVLCTFFFFSVSVARIVFSPLASQVLIRVLVRVSNTVDTM